MSIIIRIGLIEHVVLMSETKTQVKSNTGEAFVSKSKMGMGRMYSH
jgi:hypothetical protein